MHIKYGCRTCTIMHCGSLLANSGLRVNLAPEISLRLGVNVDTAYFYRIFRLSKLRIIATEQKVYLSYQYNNNTELRKFHVT